jgi:integrase
MPWRKYRQKKGKHGPIYHVAKGVIVRQDARGYWTIHINRGGDRKNKTIGPGRESLVKAIKASEIIAGKLDSITNAHKPYVKKKPSSPKFEAYSKQWLEGNVGRWSRDTYRRYEDILRLHIWPDRLFKGKRLTDIERGDIKMFLRKMLKTHAPRSVEIDHSVLCGIFEDAIDDRLLGSNPARNLRKKVLPPKRQRNIKAADVFTVEERDLFLAKAEKICSLGELLVLKVMAFTGFRLGEALAMRLDNLDVRKMAYHVLESYKLHRFTKPKFGKTRLVDLPAFLVEELQGHILHLKEQSLKEGTGGEVDLLFLDPKERNRWPYSQRRIQEIMKKACRKAGLRTRNPHDLRHTYATTLLMAHQSPAYVKEQLGHSSIAITVDIYGHWFPEEGRNGLEEALVGPVPDPGEKCIKMHMAKNKGL